MNKINENIEYFSGVIDALFYASEENSKHLSLLLEPLFKADVSTLESCFIYKKAMILNFNEKFLVENYEEKYEKLIQLSSEGKCKEGQYLFANRLYEKKQYKEAIKLYKESSYQGYAPAQWCYGIDLFNGIKDVLPKNEEKGLLYIEFSAAQSYEYALEFLINRYTTIKEKKGEDMIRLDMYTNMLKLRE